MPVPFVVVVVAEHLRHRDVDFKLVIYVWVARVVEAGTRFGAPESLLPTNCLSEDEFALIPLPLMKVLLLALL